MSDGDADGLGRLVAVISQDVDVARGAVGLHAEAAVAVDAQTAHPHRPQRQLARRIVAAVVGERVVGGHARADGSAAERIPHRQRHIIGGVGSNRRAGGAELVAHRGRAAGRLGLRRGLQQLRINAQPAVGRDGDIGGSVVGVDVRDAAFNRGDGQGQRLFVLGDAVVENRDGMAALAAETAGRGERAARRVGVVAGGDIAADAESNHAVGDAARQARAGRIVKSEFKKRPGARAFLGRAVFIAAQQVVADRATRHPHRDFIVHHQRGGGFEVIGQRQRRARGALPFHGSDAERGDFVHLVAPAVADHGVHVVEHGDGDGGAAAAHLGRADTQHAAVGVAEIIGVEQHRGGAVVGGVRAAAERVPDGQGRGVGRRDDADRHRPGVAFDGQVARARGGDAGRVGRVHAQAGVRRADVDDGAGLADGDLRAVAAGAGADHGPADAAAGGAGQGQPQRLRQFKRIAGGQRHRDARLAMVAAGRDFQHPAGRLGVAGVAGDAADQMRDAVLAVVGRGEVSVAAEVEAVAEAVINARAQGARGIAARRGAHLKHRGFALAVRGRQRAHRHRHRRVLADGDALPLRTAVLQRRVAEAGALVAEVQVGVVAVQQRRDDDGLGRFRGAVAEDVDGDAVRRGAGVAVRQAGFQAQVA